MPDPTTPPPLDDRVTVRDEIAGFPIGGGYYATAVGVDEAGEIADAVLAVLDLPARDNAVARKALSRLAANRHKVGLSVAAYHPNLAVELLDDSKAVIAYRDTTYPTQEAPYAR